MIYLILKISGYLLIALACGIGTGWLIRNTQASKREDEMQRSITESRSRVPQFESLMRTRDEQVKRLKDDVSARDEQIRELTEVGSQKESELREKMRELKAMTTRNEALEIGADPDSLDSADATTAAVDHQTDPVLVAELRAQIARLERDLADARASAADAVAEAAAAEAEVFQLRKTASDTSEAPQQAASTDANGGSREVVELEARLRQKAEEHDRLNRTLENEQRKVVELERERELQNKSLQVLHQQLELERERPPGAASNQLS